MKVALVFLLLATALAGCSDEAEPEKADDHAHHGASEFGGDTSIVTEAPAWEVGQYWSFTDGNGTEFDLVVAADEGTSWLVLQNNPGNALYDFLADVSFLGSIRKSDLSGSQGTDTVRFFDWPLEHNKDWTTSWDGESRHARAHAAQGGKWHIGVHAGGSDAGLYFAEMSYDPSIGWFDSMIFYNEAGTVAYQLQLTGSGTGFVGEVFRYTEIDVPHLTELTGPAGNEVQSVFEVGEDVTEVHIFWDITCGAADAPLFAYQPPGPDGAVNPAPPLPVLSTDAYGNDQPCPNVNELDGPIDAEVRPGVWRFDAVVPVDSTVVAYLETRVRETFTF